MLISHTKIPDAEAQQTAQIKTRREEAAG